MRTAFNKNLSNDSHTYMREKCTETLDVALQVKVTKTYNTLVIQILEPMYEVSSTPDKMLNT